SMYGLFFQAEHDIRARNVTGVQTCALPILATYIIQFAKVAGARVIVTSRSAKKRKRAEEIGADLAIDTASDWEKELKNETIDLVIDSVGRATFNRSLEVVKRGGTMVVFGERKSVV